MLIRPSAPSPWKVARLELEFHGIDAMTSAASAAPMSSISAEDTIDSGDGESAALRFKYDPVTTTSSIAGSSSAANKVVPGRPTSSALRHSTNDFFTYFPFFTKQLTAAREIYLNLVPNSFSSLKRVRFVTAIPDG